MSEFDTAFPGSRKTYVTGAQGVLVPMREIALGGGEPSLRVYDTSGPENLDVVKGLPKLREGWVTPTTCRTEDSTACSGSRRGYIPDYCCTGTCTPTVRTILISPVGTRPCPTSAGGTCSA